MGSRRRSRECALQVLYLIDANDEGGVDMALQRYWASFDGPDDARPFAEELVRGTYRQRTEIDEMISSAATNWRIERMGRVDRNILRCAVYEMLAYSDIPPRVTINEAVELAKRFGSEDTPRFVNGVLDAIRQKLGRE
ncbi:MAG TPA: transcription antitermination factor NusB [Myxococcota bacterium]|jgi:N utilization substance protein B|nr:transcription antitermination factor NusB [Myxococcota bacterium]